MTASLVTPWEWVLNNQVEQSIRVRAFFSLDLLVLPCFLQLYSGLHVSDYHDFWNTERLKSYDYFFFAPNNCFSYRNIFQNGVDALAKLPCPCNEIAHGRLEALFILIFTELVLHSVCFILRICFRLMNVKSMKNYSPSLIHIYRKRF